MRKRLNSIVIALFFIGSLGASSHLSLAGNGAALFESLKCGACHKPEQKAAGVSLTEIAKAYVDSAKLVAFFKGEGPFLIESTKTGMMKGQLKNLATLSDQDKKALSDYMLSFK